MQTMIFRNYTDADYDAVCNFLIELNEKDCCHINWNWARFEWMYGHPLFDAGSRDAFGLWFSEGKVVGAAIYDMYFGEAFCGVLPEYDDLFPKVLQYAYEELRDDAGLGIAVCDGCAKEADTATALGFTRTKQTETVMKLELIRPFSADLPHGFSISAFDPLEDYEKLQWLFWQGFDHGEDRSEFEKELKKNLQLNLSPRPHFCRDLSLVAVAPDGEYAACCGLWYHDLTDYAYVEPVCTVPSCRKKGLARALLSEALNRAEKLGAKKAYVISDLPFYQDLGFQKDHHYSFYRKP